MSLSRWVSLLLALVVVVGAANLVMVYRHHSAAQQSAKPPVSTDAPLAGTPWSWTHTEFVDGKRTNAPAGDRFVLSLTADGRVSSTTDCNALAGTYAMNGEVLSFSPFISTKKACAGETLETEYAKQLARTASYVIAGNELRLNLIKDSGVMVFERK